MLIAIEYQGRQIHYFNPHPKLPILRKDGSVAWVAWGLIGLRGQEPLPRATWLLLDDIKAGLWAAFKPAPVKVPAEAFCISNPASRELLKTRVPSGQFLQGVVMQINAGAPDELAAYIVVVEADTQSKLWRYRPRLV